MMSVDDFSCEMYLYPQINADSLGKLVKSTASNPQLLKDIFISYIDDSRELIEEMKTSIDENTPDHYFAAVHSLKGLAGTIGCTRMFQLLKHMDACKYENQFGLSTAYVKLLSEIFEELILDIRQKVLEV